MEYKGMDRRTYSIMSFLADFNGSLKKKNE